MATGMATGLGRTAAVALFVSLVAPVVAAEEVPSGPDWAAVANVDVVEILTINEDGSTKETKIWLLVMGGEGYIRTGSTSWFANIERNPEVVLRIEEDEQPFWAEVVNDPVVLEAAQEGFREKYGFEDWLVGLWPGGGERVMRLVPRDPTPEVGTQEAD